MESGSTDGNPKGLILVIEHLQRKGENISLVPLSPKKKTQCAQIYMAHQDAVCYELGESGSLL